MVYCGLRVFVWIALETSMATNTINVISLGTSADIDTSEWANYASENAGILVGQTFGSAGSPLYQNNLTTLTLNDPNNDGLVTANDNFQSAEQLTAFGVSHNLDSITEWDVTLTYKDGSTATTRIVLLQDTSGRLFLAPMVTGNSNNDPLDDAAIESVQLNSMTGDNYGGVFTGLANIGFVCFAPGTRIETPYGERLVETLRAGDLVTTLDNGPCRLVWTAARTLNFPPTPASQKPILFKEGCFGPQLPDGDLIVSPQHRFLCQTRQGERLAIAKSFEALRGVRRMNGKYAITYHSLMFEQHEIVIANRLAVESFYPGRYAMSLLDPIHRFQIIVRFPQLLNDLNGTYGGLVRPALKFREACELLQRGRLNVPTCDIGRFDSELRYLG